MNCIFDIQTLQRLENRAIDENDQEMVSFARSEQCKVLNSYVISEDKGEKYEAIEALYRIMVRAKENKNYDFASYVKSVLEGLK